MELMKSNNQQLAELETLNLPSLQIKDLKELLGKSLTVTAQYIRFAARVWCELESRGEDMSALRSGLTRYLPLVNEGKLDAAVVIKFAGQQLLLREVAMMSIGDQERLANGEKIPLVSLDSFGNPSTSFVDITHIHSRYYPRVFDMGKIRSESEQANILAKTPRRKRRQQKVRSKKVEYDRHVFQCGQTKILAQDIVYAISKATGKSSEEVKTFIGMTEE